MVSLWLYLGSIFLGILCTNSSPILNDNETWIFIPNTRGPFILYPEKEHSIQSRAVHEPLKPDSRIFHSTTKLTNNVISCGSYILGPGQTVVIRSRNYKGGFLQNRDYRWTFKGSNDGSKITVACSINTVRSCSRPSLVITENDVPSRLCEKYYKLTKTSTDNKMKIFFNIDRRYVKSENFACRVSASVPQPSGLSLTLSTTTPTPTSPEPCKPCGTVNRVTRIVGGVQTEVNEYPWQVALVNAGTNTVICGGSLLNNVLILTAASCIQMMATAADKEILVGAHDINNPTEVHQRIGLAKAGYFQTFNAATKDNDIGLIWLATPAILSDRVKPICFPDPAKDYSGFLAVTSGWGNLAEGGSPSSILNEVELPVITNEACNASYPFRVTPNMICAGYQEGNKGACEGDTGGPLMVADNGTWVLAGIRSWGDGCARVNAPGVFVRVSQYIDVLASLLASEGANTLCDGY
ncbi:clotting factor G beta subunit-like [Palaemon carinicauda]|uniref:clotting factor G beta subunit-like n=1 Tax=Palaemon carinicauda TaxID=392227 RepID=UPI0035B5F366